MSFTRNSIFIRIQGDPSVGIPTLQDVFSLQWDLDDPEGERERVREIISEAWRELYDDSVSVNFGDECPDCLGIQEHKLNCPNFYQGYRIK